MSISLNTLVCLLLSLLKSSPIFSAREIFLQQWEWGRASINWAWASSNGQFVTGDHAIATKLSFCRNHQQLNNCVIMSILGLGFTGKYHSTKTVSGQLWSIANISVFCWSCCVRNRKHEISWPCQSGLPPVVQSTFLVKSHMVLIAWRLSCKPPCHVAPLTKMVLNYHETTWFDLWCCQQVWAWRKFQGGFKKKKKKTNPQKNPKACILFPLKIKKKKGTFNNSLVGWGGAHLNCILQHYFIKHFFQPINLLQPLYCRDLKIDTDFPLLWGCFQERIRLILHGVKVDFKCLGTGQFYLFVCGTDSAHPDLTWALQGIL